MNKTDRIFLIGVCAKLETVIESLADALEGKNDMELITIINDQINAIQGIVNDILEGGGVNG